MSQEKYIGMDVHVFEFWAANLRDVTLEPKAMSLG